MLKYIVSGEKPEHSSNDIDEIDTIVTKVKGREEVTKEYMRQRDRELSIKRDTKEEAALKDICFDLENNIPAEITRKRLKENFGYDSNTIDELIKQAKENKELVLNAGI